MTFVYIAGLFAAYFIAVHRRAWLLSAAAFSWFYMAGLVTFGNGSEAWLRGTWAPREAASLLLSLAAVGFAIYRETQDIDPARRFWLRFGACVTPVSIVGLVWLGVHHNDWYWVFVDARARMWQWAAFALGLVCWLAPQRAGRDSLFLLWIAAAHAIIAPLVHISGAGERVAYRAIAVAACLWWIAFPSPPQTAPASRETQPGSPADAR